jgi:hypothetical protein
MGCGRKCALHASLLPALPIRAHLPDDVTAAAASSVTSEPIDDGFLMASISFSEAPAFFRSPRSASVKLSGLFRV